MVQWISMNVLVMAYCLSGFIPPGFPIVTAVCLGALGMMSWTIWNQKYFWAAGFVAVAAMSSPFPLVIRLFFLIGLAGIIASAIILVTFQMQRCSLVEGPKKEGIPCHSDYTY